MVHALEEIHRLLKPTGRLIDIHPMSQPMPVELHHSGTIEPIGDLSVRQWCIDFEQADEALAEILRRNVFAVELEDVFDALTYYDSPEEMRDALRGSLDRFARDAPSVEEGVPKVEEIAARSEELIGAAGEGAQLAVRERTHIRRLRPT